MSTVTFDTHTAIEYLIGKGIKKQQAEAIIKTMQQSKEIDFNSLVTKDYLDMKLKAELNEVKVDMLKWFIGVTIAQVFIIIAAFKILGH